MGLAVLVSITVVEKGEYVKDFAEFYDHAIVAFVKIHLLITISTDSRRFCEKCREGTQGQVWLFLGIHGVRYVKKTTQVTKHLKYSLGEKELLHFAHMT